MGPSTSGSCTGPAAVTQNSLIDLHLHLDGSLSLRSAEILAEMQEIEIPKEKKILENIMKIPPNCKNLNDYLKRFEFPLFLLQTEEALSESVYRLQEELAGQGLIYAEIRFAPQLHMKRGLSQEQAVKAALNGLERSSFNANLILCCMLNDSGNKQNRETIRLTEKYIGEGVSAADMAGVESLYPLKDYKKLFDYAAGLGVPFTIHAGEAAGAENIWTALSYGAKRLGHGIRAEEDKKLIKFLADRRIPLEMCPTSNLNTKAIKDIRDYPIKKYMEAGIPVTVNTDNMTVSDTSLRKELQLIADTFNFGEKTIKQLLMNSAEAAFAGDRLKEKMKLTIEAAFKNSK